jgi:hypothetical protein
MKPFAALFSLLVACSASPARPVQPSAPPLPPPATEPKPSAATVRAATPSPPLEEAPPSAREPGPPAPDLLGELDSVPTLRAAADAWLDEQRSNAGEDLLTLVSAKRFSGVDAAALLVVIAPPDAPGTSRRVFGLVATNVSGSRTLAMPSEPCGELQEYLLDLHGDGARFAIFTEVGGGHHCQLTGVTVAYELASDSWIDAVAPSYVLGTPEDVNSDGKPDFPSNLATLNLGHCYYAACGDYFFRVDIDGYESWDGKQFVSGGGRYQSFYAERYRELVEGARALSPIVGCATERLREGARAFGYAILSGHSRGEALALSRRYFRGVRIEDCTEEGPLLSLAQIEQELLRALPALASAR